MQNSYRAFDSTSELAFRGPWPFRLRGVATDPSRNLGAKSGARSAESLASPEAVEPGSGVFRRRAFGSPQLMTGGMGYAI